MLAGPAGGPGCTNPGTVAAHAARQEVLVTPNQMIPLPIRPSLALAAPALIVLAATAATTLHACGGCPWLHASPVSVEPSMPCLELGIADTTGEGDSTGCVDPVLHGWNHCTETLVLPPAAPGSPEVSFAPGDRIVHEVDLGTSIRRENDTNLFELPARLGTTDIIIRFSVW